MISIRSNLYLFFEVVSLMRYCICHLLRSSVENILEKYYLLDISSKSHLKLSNNIIKWPQLTPIYFYEQANHIRWPWTNFTLSPRALNSLLTFSNFENHIGARRMNQQPCSEPIGSDKDRKKFSRCLSTPINNISIMCFHLNRVGNGNDDISSEEHVSLFLSKYFNSIW